MDFNSTELLFVFEGYGIFLALFPFCILLGSISQYQDAYAQQAVMPPRLPLYRDSVKFTNYVLGYVNTLPFMKPPVPATAAKKSS